MPLSFKSRANLTEIMDDLSRPQAEFDLAYHELTSINRRLGGVRAVQRFLPEQENLLILDVAAGACDVGEALIAQIPCHVVSLDIYDRGLKLANRTWPVMGDALDLPFRDGTFDVVMASLFFHHLSNKDCAKVLASMWRITRRRVLVNDLHRHIIPYYSFQALAMMFSKSPMIKHDGPVSVRRAFKPADLLEIAKAAGVPARVHRSFPYRLVLVADKQP
jgi:ubiquinone/menaquinone biosynthesis C-methylase UbiE